MSKKRFKNVQLLLFLILTYVVITSPKDGIQKKISLWTNEKDDLSEDELRIKIMKIFEDDIVKNTPDEVCIRIANLSQIDSCFSKPIRIITQETKELLLACSNFRNLSSLRTFLRNHRRLNELDLHVLAKCLDFVLEMIPVEDYFNFINVLKKCWFYDLTLPSLSKHFFFEFISHLQDDNSTFILVDSDYILKVWNPFSDDVSGLVVYPDQRYTELYTNQSVDNNIVGTNIKFAVHITSDYLNYLNDHLTVEEKRNFRVIIILVVDEMLSQLFLRDDDEYLGIYMPGICIDTNLPIIKIGRNKLSRTIELNEFDTLGCAAAFCSGYKMLFLDISVAFNKNACPNTSALSIPIIWPEILDTSLYYPNNFCFSDVLWMPRITCYNSRRQIYFEKFNEIKCLEGLSDATEQSYQILKCCKYRQFYCCTGEKIKFIPVQNYVDIKIQTEYSLLTRNDNSDEVSLEKTLDVIDVGLDVLKFDEQPFHLFDLILRLFWDVYPFYYASLNEKKRKNFICRFMDADTQGMGFSLRKTRYNSEEGYNYDLEYLPFNNTSSYAHSNDIEALVFPEQPKEFALALIFIIQNSELAHNLSFICKSRIMIIVSWGYVPTQYFRIYLKIVDTPDNLNIFSNEGYWFDLEIRSTSLSMVCVSELKENVCNSNKTITVHQSTTVSEPEPSYIISKISVTHLDLLSQLATSMNPDSKQTYLKHRDIFKMIIYIGSSLSIVGISCIFLSAIFLKDWFAKRFNTTQLSITLTIEIIFFYFDHKIGKHIGYLIFFYSVLAQFAWMLLIGYHQYHKFIKVFAAEPLSKTKSLIVGWLSPGLIILIPLVLHWDCLECDQCYKNRGIFNYFVIIPICCVILINLIVYAGVMCNISKISGAEVSSKVRKAKIRAAILFPFLMGLSWISIFALFVPSLWISLGAAYTFHVVTPSQGFILSVFTVFFEENTRQGWRNKWKELFKEKK